MNVQLRPILETDLPVFFAHQIDAESAAMAGVPSRDADAFASHWIRIQADPQNIMRTVMVDGRVAGNVVSFPMDGQRHIGYFLGKGFWGKGIATRALADFLETVVTERPLVATVAPHNAGSRRVLEKCGFEFIGEITDHLGSVNEFILR